MQQELARTGLEPLLHREQQVLTGVRGGLSNRQIAAHIHVCEDTVKYHLKRIFRRLGVSRRSEAVAVAMYNGLLDGFDRNGDGNEGLNGLDGLDGDIAPDAPGGAARQNGEGSEAPAGC